MEPSPADQQRAIDALSDGTGMSRDDAAYYLMTNGWNAEMAASAFFAESEESEVVSSAPRVATAAPSAAVPLPTSRPTPKPKPASSGGGGGKGGIRSLSDLKRAGGSDDESGSDDDGDKMNEYYAGGEKSGMLVQAPKRRNEAPPSGGNALDSLIQAATRQGAEEQTERSQQQGHSKAFAGSGYRLGATDLGPSASKPSGPAAKPELRKKLVLWKQGFTVDDDGPLRLYGEPANEQFLAAVTAGRMPAELAQLQADVSLDVSDRRGEPYVAPAVPRPLFQGQGHTLGSSSTSSTSSATPSAAVKQQQPPALTVTVDDTQPTTQLQIRLLDGSKIVAKFNTSHTVLHVRAYINRERPSKAAYVLSTAFPPLPISDESKTLQELGLLNSVLVQKAA